MRMHSKRKSECTCQHVSGDKEYKADRECPVTGHRYVSPPSPCDQLLYDALLCNDTLLPSYKCSAYTFLGLID